MIKSNQIPLSKPSLSDDDIASVVDVLKSGKLVSGRIVETFERQLAAYLGARHAVCVSSGTASLHLGLLALGIGPGDEVIVPAFSYPASANAVELIGANPVFIDSEKDGFNVDTDKIETSITSRTKAIMVVHNFGWPVEIDKIQTLSAKYDIPIIEDAACALGSSIGGKRCGNLGKLATFSFHPRKILTTGEGGAVVTNDSRIAEAVKRLRNHGQSYDNGVEFVLPGFNYRLTEFQAALGSSQMERFDSTIRERQEAAAYYDEHLSSFEFLRLHPRENNRKTNFQTYVAIVSEGSRNKLINHLKENGIEAGIGTYSIPHTLYYSKKINVDSSMFPESWKAFENLISLPLYEGITSKDQDHVINTIKRFETKNKIQPVYELV